jgi:rhamnose utilization protein RhaD (predicted bifunctional aldolase and dehydrogenase)
VELSLHLGDPARDYVILGEGNTSARIDESSFWVKASGRELSRAEESSFVRVGFEGVLELLEQGTLGDAQIKEGLLRARVEPTDDRVPSVEALFHALCLREEGVQFVGHTHPTWLNMVTCSRDFAAAIQGRLFPDEIVVCGIEPLAVPYVDPGVPLAREIGDRLLEYRERQGERPKTVLLQNHGLIALGKTASQVEDITAMAVKTCRILVGTGALGGPCHLDPQLAERIHRRPDEHYRQRFLGMDSPPPGSESS